MSQEAPGQFEKKEMRPGVFQCDPDKRCCNQGFTNAQSVPNCSIKKAEYRKIKSKI
jgi:hypothetical protein